MKSEIIRHAWKLSKRIRTFPQCIFVLNSPEHFRIPLGYERDEWLYRSCVWPLNKSVQSKFWLGMPRKNKIALWDLM